MKKLIISGIFSALFLAVFAQTDVPNGNFEKWDTIYNPVNFATSNAESYSINGTPNVTRTTDRYHLMSAVRMETSNYFAGYVISGKVGIPINGSFSYDGGIPYTTVPDSFVAFIKYNCTHSDSGLIFLLFKRAGVPIAVPNMYSVYGTSNTFKRISFPVNKPSLPISPDTVIVAFCSSIPGSHSLNNGNWMIADFISFQNKSGLPAAIPNNDFENWEPAAQIPPNPDQWNSMNPFSVYLGIAPSVTQSTSFHGGKYAANIKTTDYNFGSASNKLGFLMTGSINSDEPQGFKLTTIPDSVGFWYKYDNSKNNLDSAMFVVLFNKYNSVNKKSSTVDSYFVSLAASISYKHKIIPFKNISGKNPDTANVILSSSNLLDTTYNAVGNNLTIDDINFYFAGTGIPSDFVISNLKIYPSPASEYIHLNLLLSDHTASIKFTVFDLNGKNRLEKSFEGLNKGENEFNIDISGLVTGEYILNICSDRSFIFNKRFEVIR